MCSYDRAGFGWSESRPSVRDSNAISSELHGLLKESRTTGPIILMGHSIAGIHMREYEARYPEGVKGIVFLDGSTPLQDDRFPASFREEEKKCYGKLPWYKFLTIIGVARLMGQCSQVDRGFAAVCRLDQGRFVQPPAVQRGPGRASRNPAVGDETARLGPFGDLPILIFSQDPDKPMSSFRVP